MTEDHVPDFSGHLDKDELKRRLPLEYVCQQLGIRLDREGRALCPLHADSAPSFYLFDADDGARLWWCHPCGKGGDVLQLIMEVEWLSFPAALERANELVSALPVNYTVEVELDLPETRELEWSAEENRAAITRAVSAPGQLSLRTGLVDEPGQPHAVALDAFLRTWGWGLLEDGGVTMPHLSADGKTLTGCKVRYQGGARVSRRGSKYDALYGAWHVARGTPEPAVLVCEGETDALWAAYRIRLGSLHVDVVALPGGAGRPPTSDQVSFLKTYHTIYLALDPDQAGVSATREWITALHGAGATDVRVCRLPLERDLRDARPDLRALLAAARRPLENRTNVQVVPGGFLRTNKDGDPYIVTNWTVDPIARLSGGESGYQVDLHYLGAVVPTTLRLADLASVHNFNRWANRQQVEFRGSDNDRKAISEWIEHRAVVLPEVFQAEQVGSHAPPAEYAFAGRSVIYPRRPGVLRSYEGKLPWEYVPTGFTADVTDDILLPTDLPRFTSWNWLEDFIALSSTDVTHPLLAWLIASARRPEVSEFPILFLGGSSGVGKSTIAKLACRIMGSKITVNLGGDTPFILFRKLASSTSLPVFIDEWTRMSRPDTRVALQGVIPMLYAGELAERGQGDLSAVGYRLTAPAIIAGEDTFALDRERERTITLALSRAAQNRQALLRLSTRPLEQLGGWTHRWIMQHPDLPALDTVRSTRPGYNRRVLEAGWETLLLMLEADSEAGNPSVPSLPTEPDLSHLDLEEQAEEENVYEIALQEAAPLRDQNGIPIVWQDPEGRGTWVRFTVLVGLVKQRQIDVDLPGGSRAMANYFTERYGELTGSKRISPPGSSASVRASLIPGLLVGDTPSAFDAVIAANGKETR